MPEGGLGFLPHRLVGGQPRKNQIPRRGTGNIWKTLVRPKTIRVSSRMNLHSCAPAVTLGTLSLSEVAERASVGVAGWAGGLRM